MLIKHPQEFPTALQGQGITGMTLSQKQFPLNRGVLRKQVPIGSQPSKT